MVSSAIHKGSACRKSAAQGAVKAAIGMVKTGYVHNSCFVDERAEELIFASGEDLVVPDGSILSREKEVALFLQYNYAKYRISELLEAGNGRSVKRGLNAWIKTARRTRSLLARLNIRLVWAMAKRTRITNVDYDDLVSEGSMALLRSIDKFDVSRGYRFSTYACRAIIKSFARLARQATRRHHKFTVSHNEVLELLDAKAAENPRGAPAVQALCDIIQTNRANLNKIEQIVIDQRYPLSPERKKRTLSQVGMTIGMTQERVRQIQIGALRKLRVAVGLYLADARSTRPTIQRLSRGGRPRNNSQYSPKHRSNLKKPGVTKQGEDSRAAQLLGAASP